MQVIQTELWDSLARTDITVGNKVVEHVGEVRTVVSAVPLTREEFARKYLGESSPNASTEVIDVTETQATPAPVTVVEEEHSEEESDEF